MNKLAISIIFFTYLASYCMNYEIEGITSPCESDYSCTPLHYSIVAENFRLLKRYVREHTIDIDTKDSYGYTPLLTATLLNVKFKIIKFLLEHGANVNAANASGETSLMFAASNGNKELAKFLITKGACLTQTNNDKDTALSYAIKNGSLQTAILILNEENDILKLDPNKTSLNELEFILNKINSQTNNKNDSKIGNCEYILDLIYNKFNQTI